MNKILVTDPTGTTQELSIEPGMTLMEHLRDADYDEVPALCGGCCSCATCHVLIENVVGELPPIEDIEQLLLETADGYQPGKSRLSCQLELDNSHAGLALSLPANDF